MNNRAVTTGGIVVIILGFLVILLIITGPLKVGYDYAKEKFFGEHSIFSSLALSREAEFQPYTGANVQMSSEEVIVDNSVKAFICAVNSLALGKPGWLEKNVCPEGFTFPGMPEKESTVKAVGKAWSRLTGAVTADQCSGALYGQSCVECATLEQGMNVIQLSDNDFTAAQQLVDAVIDCWKKFQSGSKTNVYCSKAVIPAATSFSSWIIKERDFRNGLNVRAGIGDDLAGYSLLGQDWLGYSSKNYKWNVPSQLLPSFSPVFICAKTKSAWGGSDREDKVVLTFDKSDCYVTEAPPEKEFKCSVKDFELPQEIDKGIYLVDFAMEWVARYNDPQYLVYYESFPRSEASAWHVNEGNFFIDVVLLGSAMNVLPMARGFGGKIWGKLFSKEAKNVGKEAAEVVAKRIGADVSAALGQKAAKELSSVLSRDGYEVLMRSERLLNELYSGLPKGLPNELEDLRYGIFKQYSIYKSANKNNEEIVFLLSKDIDAGIFGPRLVIDEKTAVKNAMVSFVKNPLSDAEMEALQRSVTAKQFFTKYLTKEVGEGIDPKLLDELFSKVVSREVFEGLAEESAEAFSAQAAKNAEQIVDLTKDGSAAWRLTSAGSAAVQRDLEKVAEEVTSLNSAKLERFFMGVSIDEMREAAKGGVLKAVSARYNPLVIKIRGKDILVPRKLLLRGLWSGAGSLYNVPKAGATLASDVFWRPRAVRYSVAYAIGLAIAQADADNDKYRSRGGDSVVLQKPYLFEKNKVYSLSKDTSNFFLSLFKFSGGKKGLSRFFLASPCKADLAVTQTTCSCGVSNGEYLLASNFQPLEKGYIKKNSDDAFVHIALFDSASEALKGELILKCLAGGEYGKVCARNIAKDAVVYDKFVHYVYNSVYVPSLEFLKENDLYDELGNAIHSQFSVNDGLNRLASSIYFDQTPDLAGDPNFPAFYALSRGTSESSVVASIFAPLVVESGPLSSVGASDSVKIRETPMNFENFKNEFESQIFSAWFNDPVIDISRAINTAHLNFRSSFGNLLDDNQFLGAAANKTFLNYYSVKDSMIDKSVIAKTCDIGAISKTSDNVFERTDLMAGRVSIPCFTVNAALDPAYTGHNYCFSGDTSYIDNMKWVFTGIALVIDVGVGLTGAGLFVEAPVAIVTGGAAAWAGHELDKRQWWPNH